MQKDNNGRFLPGAMSEDWKQRISEGQVRRHARARQLEEEIGAPPVDKKRCTQCGEWKRVNVEDTGDSEFTIRRRRLKSGIVKKYPSPECKKCGARRRREWQARQDKEQVRARQRQWNKSRDREARKRYNREWGRIRRIEEGVVPRGPWKRYRHEVPGEDRVVVDARPLVELIKPLTGYGNNSTAPLKVDGRVDIEELRRLHRMPNYEDLAIMANLSSDKVSMVMSGKRSRLTPHEAERLLSVFGMEDKLLVLYPELVGC